MPSASVAPDPMASCARRDAEEHQPADPGLRRPRPPPCAASRACAGRRRASSRSAAGSASPSVTNIGSTRSRRVPAGSARPAPRIAGRAYAAGAAGRPGSGAASVSRAVAQVALRRGGGALLRRAQHRLAGLRRRPRAALAPYSAARRRARATDGVGASTSTRRPCSSAVFAVAGPMQAMTVDGVRLAGDADQVAHRRGRREHDRVEAAALDRLADRRGRRRGAHGAVGRDVVDLPAALDQPGDQVLGGDVGPRQEHPVDRVEARRRTAASPRAGRRRTARRWAPGRA